MTLPLWSRFGGPLLVLGIAVLIEFSAHFGFKIPNPPSLLLLAVVYATFIGGYWPGFISAGLAWVYIAWFFSLPAQPFHYTDENLVRVVVWGVTTPLMAWMVAHLKYRTSHLSEIEKANTALYTNERRLTTLLGNLPGYIYRCYNDRDWTTEFVSSGVIALTGYQPEQFVAGKPTLNEIVHPEDRQRVWDEIQRAIAKRERFQLEYRIHTAKGEEKCFWEQGCGIFNERGELEILEGFVTDITERKQAEEALQMMRFSVDHAGDGVFWISPEGLILYVNQSVCKGLGYTRGELLGMTIFDLDPDYQPGVWAPHWLELKQQGTLTFETRHRTKKGLVFPIEVNANYVNVGGQEFNFAFTRDITERKRTEAALRVSERRFHRLIESNVTGVIIANTDGRITEASDLFLQMVGYTREELEAGHVSWDTITPPEWKWVDEYIIEQLRTRGVCKPVEKEYFHKDGHRVPVFVSVALIEGTTDDGICFIADLTKSKQADEALRTSEAQLSATVKMAHMGPWEYDVVKDLFTFNDHFYAFLRTTAEREGGYTMSSAQYAQRFAYPDDAALVGREIQLALETTDPDYNRQLEHRVIFGDGKVGYISVRIFVVKDQQGRTIKTHGVNQDITAAKQMEEHLTHSQKMEAVGQLTGGVAHDFNNRLTVVLGNLELLQRKLGNDPATAELLKSAISGTIGAAELTRQLLTFSRQQVLEPTVFNINELVTEMHDMLQRTLGETITIVISPGPDLWTVRTDRHLLENALLNLALNARDAMPKGGRLTIETTNTMLGKDYIGSHLNATPGEYVQLTVSDTGTGMNEEAKQRAFEPFFTTKEKGKGTGLGLAMVYGFVKQSEGQIDIYSEPGHGTSFKIYFPRELSGEKTDLVNTEQKAGDENTVFHDKVILLVEDEAQVRNMVVTLLGNLGCRVLSADSGPAALEIFAKTPDIDLLFTDIIMPGGMTGLELAVKIRERAPELKVLYTSGYAPQAAADRRTIEHPNDYWLAKPYRFKTLKSMIIKVFGT